jgi:hypothetical protein
VLHTFSGDDDDDDDDSGGGRRGCGGGGVGDIVNNSNYNYHTTELNALQESLTGK